MELLTNKEFQRLVSIMDDLREKCPWDKKQTIQTLRQLTIEETFELADAVTDSNWQGIKEELGDILLHIIFYSKIGAEQNYFNLYDVINGVCEKLINRHPHIYGDTDDPEQLVKVNDEEDVKRNWEKIKLKEGKASALSGVPKSLPAMVKAMRLQEKAKQAGFEWDAKEQVWEKIEEEKSELLQAVQSGVHQDIEEELGDLLFSVINYARFVHVDAENALALTNKKFIERFSSMEKMALASGKALSDMQLNEMDALWDTIKQQNKQLE
ncbi:MAG: nucleoside triphosphate pyrophosphohydrolase [Ginsengibacter sp.]